MDKCVNLMERFGKRYRIEFDPAYNPKHRPRAKLDPWMMVIPGRYGTIYPDGGDYLRVDIDHHNQIAKRVGCLAVCQLVQDGEFEKTIRFPVDRLDDIAAIVHPHRKPHVSPVQRERLRRHMAKINSQRPRKSREIGVSRASSASA